MAERLLTWFAMGTGAVIGVALPALFAYLAYVVAGEHAALLMGLFSICFLVVFAHKVLSKLRP